MKKNWSKKADKAVCKNFLKGKTDDVSVSKLQKKYGHSQSSVKMRIRNYTYLDTDGTQGLSNYSKQEFKTYHKLKHNKFLKYGLYVFIVCLFMCVIVFLFR